MNIERGMPLRIYPCPIQQAVFEVRFKSEHPADAVFGMVYSAVKDLFLSAAPKVLPVMQIPETVRM